MNKIFIKGRLTKDPESKVAQKGINVCKFSVAVNGRNKEAKATFFNCTAFGNTATAISTYLFKGKEVLIEGSMNCSVWDGNDGKKVYSWELLVDNFEFCGSKTDNINNTIDDIPFDPPGQPTATPATVIDTPPPSMNSLPQQPVSFDNMQPTEEEINDTVPF